MTELIGIEYISWRTCIGLWAMVILIILAATEATKLVTSFTRFSEEIFTSVVAIFFVSEAVYYLYHVSICMTDNVMLHHEYCLGL